MIQRGTDSGYLEELIKANSKPNGNFDLRGKIKFSMKKEELEQKIAELDKSTIMLERLRLSGSLMHDENINSSSRTITKLAGFLHSIRKHANSLYSAISSGWAAGCHAEHRIRLYLENRSAPLQKERSIITFKLDLAVMSQTLPSKLRWQQTQIDLFEEAEPNDFENA